MVLFGCKNQINYINTKIITRTEIAMILPSFFRTFAPMINSRFIYYRSYADYLLAKPHFQFNCVYHCEENNITWFRGKEIGEFDTSDIVDKKLELNQEEINAMLTQGYILKDGEWVKSGNLIRYSESEWAVITEDPDALQALIEEYQGWDIEVYDDNGIVTKQLSMFADGILTLSADTTYDEATGTLTLGAAFSYDNGTLTIEV